MVKAGFLAKCRTDKTSLEWFVICHIMDVQIFDMSDEEPCSVLDWAYGSGVDELSLVGVGRS